MAENTALLEELFGVSPPFYVRKLSKGSDWADHKTIEQCYDNVFHDTQGAISVWRISSLLDLYQFAIAYNTSFKDHSPDKEMQLVAFTEDEVCEFGLNAIATPQGLKCTAADALHYDIADEKDKILALISHIRGVVSRKGKLTKKRFEPGMTLLKSCSCLSLTYGPCTSCA